MPSFVWSCGSLRYKLPVVTGQNCTGSRKNDISKHTSTIIIQPIDIKCLDDFPMSLVWLEYQGSQVSIGSGYGLVGQINSNSGYGLLQDVTWVKVDQDLCRYMASPGSNKFIFS